MLKQLTLVAQQIASTTKKLEKERYLSEYLPQLDDASLERAVVFFTGSPFPAHEERVTGVGWATIAEAVVRARATNQEAIGEKMQLEGDLGDAVAHFFPETSDSDVTVLQLGEFFDHLAATSGALAKTSALVELFRKLDRDEARLVTKILLNEFRIGLQTGLVESAVAKAFGQKLTDVRRAHMLNGDIGRTALLAKSGALDAASMTLFHPIGFMLAQPEEDPDKIIEQLGSGSYADDKYDGIRAQVHFDGTHVRIYSRTLDQITDRFPEVRDAAMNLEGSGILDGEIVAFSDRILPFAVLQTRIGRRKLSDKLLASAPVSFFAFDMIFHDGTPLLDTPLSDRLERLRAIVPAEGPIRLGFQRTVTTGADIDLAFDEARARINEGLVVKDPRSLYTPGRRGKTWLKYKKALATLDCVVTAAEYGHGKRRNVLSDYTFAIRNEGELLNIGKAYSGLTDVEIDRLTEYFKSITTARYGPVHVVKPTTVLEIAFDRIQESARHKSGYALRFPRIVRIREDKTLEEISTIDDVRRIYEGQLKREAG